MLRIPAGLLLIAAVSLACAQSFPSRPIRLVTSIAGGSPDFVSRVIAQGISGSLGQQVIVDNRGALKSGEVVSQAAPDGYTLLLQAASLWTASLLEKTPYDPVKDFAPISLVTTQPNLLVVTPSLPVKSVPELIALAKAKPGSLNYATSSTGAANHLAAELFKSMAGVNMVRIPYKGIGEATNDLIAGNVQVSFPGLGGIVPHIKAGRLKALAVTSLKRSAVLPELPSVAESGVPGYESVVINAVFAPAGTPQPVIDRLNRELVTFLRTPAAKQKFLSQGSEAVGSTPQELAETRKTDMVRLSKVIKDAGIHAD
jgi:tripartite-type tricarboxylate transporter receptor subunit TctC